MSRLTYLAVLVITLGSVAVGLDWQSAPMSPMPDLKVAATPWLPPQPTVVAPAPAALVPDSPAGVANTVGTGPPRPSQVQVPVGRAASDATRLNCNVSACAAAYHSFQAADCSYQPLNGPRRRCTKK